MTDYKELSARLRALTEGVEHPIAQRRQRRRPAVERCGHLLGGLLLSGGGDLVLGPFQGKTACIEIPLGKGVCGTAAAENATQLVRNVHEFPVMSPVPRLQQPKSSCPCAERGRFRRAGYRQPLPCALPRRTGRGWRPLPPTRRRCFDMSVTPVVPTSTATPSPFWATAAAFTQKAGASTSQNGKGAAAAIDAGVKYFDTAYVYPAARPLWGDSGAQRPPGQGEHRHQAAPLSHQEPGDVGEDLCRVAPAPVHRPRDNYLMHMLHRRQDLGPAVQSWGT